MSNPTQRELLIALRSEILSKRGKDGKPLLPYCVYRDEDIEALLKAQPKSLEELWAVKGFPKNGKRVQGFGQAIVDIFLGKRINKFSVKQDSKGQVIINVEIKKASGFGN